MGPGPNPWLVLFAFQPIAAGQPSTKGLADLHQHPDPLPALSQCSQHTNKPNTNLLNPARPTNSSSPIQAYLHSRACMVSFIERGLPLFSSPTAPTLPKTCLPAQLYLPSPLVLPLAHHFPFFPHFPPSPHLPISSLTYQQPILPPTPSHNNYSPRLQHQLATSANSCGHASSSSLSPYTPSSLESHLTPTPTPKTAS